MLYGFLSCDKSKFEAKSSNETVHSHIMCGYIVDLLLANQLHQLEDYIYWYRHGDVLRQVLVQKAS